MADNTTGMPVQTVTGQFVSTKLVDSGGTNVAAVDATGRLSTNIGSIGGTAPGATNPLMVELSTGAAAYTRFGQAQATAPFGIITDGTTQVGVKTVTGGALSVAIVDGSGNQITSFGGGGDTQYVGDVAATATPTGIMEMALANAAAPSDVSANADAVALWALRNGSLVVNLASGGTLITVGGKTAAASLPVVLPTDGYGSGGAAAMHVVLGTGAADYTLFGQAAATAPFARITDATTTVGVISGTAALKTDLSSIAGTAPGATSAVPSRITDGTAYYTKTGQTAGTAAYSQLSDQSNTVAVIAATNALKTDLSSIAGAVPAATNPIPVRLTDGAAFYSGDSDAPSSPQFSTKTSAALGAGASATVTHYVTSGKTGQLMGVDVGSTVPCKVVINTVVTGTPTAVVVLFTQPFQVYQWRSPFKTFITRASADATSGFSATFTNKDASVAADVYSTGYWDEQ